LIFISHSSRNNAKAIAVRDWLVRQGWGPLQVYLDLDSLHAGERWRQALNSIGSNCEAVIACLSDDWIRSPECLREFVQAESAGKPIFPLTIEKITLPIPSFITDIQIANISENLDQGFEKLRHGLLAARIGPQYFTWPPPDDPHRSVYRGLRALEEQDAAIFFGRDALIARGLDALRRMRTETDERALVILGASGAGKSSFLRAGLLARLRREESRFIVLPTIRPEMAALTGPLGLEASVGRGLGRRIDFASEPKTLSELFTELRAPALERLSRVTASRGETPHAEAPPTIILAIDQAEELYNPDNTESARFLDLMSGALTREADTLAIFTIRSDSYALLQTDKRLDPASHILFSLPPIPVAEFKNIIEGPAKLARPPIEIEHELTQKLTDDLDSLDALPLLAFALERLRSDVGADAKLTLSNYREHLGGIGGAIQAAFAEALGTHPDRDTLALVRRAFVPGMVRVDESGIRRRVATVAGLPAETMQLVDKLVQQRLLVRDRRVSNGELTDTVEVAHEAILRQWPPLVGWIEEERNALRARDLLISGAAEWTANAESIAWLVHRGERLAEAVRLADQIEYSKTLPENAIKYTSACVDRSNRIEAYRKARADAMDSYVRALLQTRIDTLNAESRSLRVNPRSDFSYQQKSNEEEIDTVANFLSPHGRWHPKPADQGGNTGPRGDFVDIFKFPCCGTVVLTENVAPRQFRADGCCESPELDA